MTPAEITADRIAKLRALASNATRGEWVAFDNEECYEIARGPALPEDAGFVAGFVPNGESDGVRDYYDTHYVAAASPDVILALLDALEAERAKVARLREMHRPERQDSVEWCASCDRMWPCETLRALADREAEHG